MSLFRSLNRLLTRAAVYGMLHCSIGAAATPTFQHDILPLIEKRCAGCHGASQAVMSGLDLRTLAGVMAGGASGPVVTPGKPDTSRLWMMVRDGKMPAGGPPLSDYEKQLIREWIEKGQFPSVQQALLEKREKIDDKARQWWSFRQPAKPPAPAVRSTARLRSPIDAFIEHKLEEKKWT